VTPFTGDSAGCCSNPTDELLPQQLRECATIWNRVLQMEVRHMQQRMPRMPRA
jgi:hypothetical protein